MPVPVDGTRLAGASKPPRSAKISQIVAVPPLSSVDVGVAPRPKKRKGKEAASQDESPWSWTLLTDSSASRVPPVLTKDGRYFLSVVGSSVKIFSVATGDLVSTLDASTSANMDSAGSSTDTCTITSVVLHPQNPFQLITGSTSGLVRIWDFLDAVLLQTMSLKHPITQIAAHEKFKDCIFVAVTLPSKRHNSSGQATTEDNAAVYHISLIPSNETVGSPVQLPSRSKKIGKTRVTTGLVLSPNGSWLVATGGHKAYVCSTSNMKGGFTKFVSPEKLTCLAFHPSGEFFATGDHVGCIRLWYCLSDSLAKYDGVERKAQTTTMHWHSHAVSSITFTANGAYLLSGGEEGVLVIWQLHSGKKEFVPRVGAPISHITLINAIDQEEQYLLALADASFVFVRSGTLKISKSIARVKLDPALSYNRPSALSAIPLAIHTPTSTIVLPSSHPSSLQFFLPASSKLVAELEVSPSNRIARRDEKPLEPSRVEHAVISYSGEWMVTIDYRDADGTFHGEVFMKFWWWDHKSQFWILNTRVDRPHGLKKVVGVAFRPKAAAPEDLLVTVGQDGNIKTWGIRLVKRQSGEIENFWVTRTTTRFRVETPSHVSWSADGSLFIVAMGPHAALYDGVTTALYQVLTCPECQQAKAAHFVGPSGRYVLVLGARELVLWDLLTKSLRWHYQSSSVISDSVVHPREESFAVFQQLSSQATEPQSTRVLLFNPSSPTPFASRTLPFGLRRVIAHPYLDQLSTASSSFTLLGITQAWSVAVLGEDVLLPQEMGSVAQKIVEEVGARRKTLFHDMFGDAAFSESTARVPSTSPLVRPWMGHEIAEVFDAPSHLMPPLRSLFDTLVDGFLTRQSNHGQEQQETSTPEDVEMDENAKPFTVETRIERAVYRDEVDTFVEFFKQCAIQAIEPGPPYQNPHTNGTLIPKANGAQPSRANDVARSFANSPILSKGTPRKALAATPTSHDTPTSKSPSVIMTGKKRKKSIG
ncbi:uncharacterized protein FIBRA_05241 [Fibroporia radiculosa]|uniref:WD repeat-containing protein 75 second beta-propeller domain-containing protein n=1 Tax=Fibroporia radiculosa TaxID=599839 RepID=J4GQM4_9APHY|nr:uncharacterized protein FIBRA_05241 [Fibroporia radiculosa]CCM03120.1 predicted protein [Fibroporia radiculosa]